MTLTYAALGLVALLVGSHIYFSTLIFALLRGEIAQANARVEKLLDRQMAQSLTDYSVAQVRQELAQNPTEEPPTESQEHLSYTGDMY